MNATLRDPIDLGPMLITFPVLSEDSDGAMTVSRVDINAGAGIPVPHSHDGFEETIYGLEGTITLTVNGEDIKIEPGDAHCIRRGEIHSFVADNGAASILAIATPGTFGPQYFLDIQEVMRAGGDSGPDLGKIGQVMQNHGLTPVPPRS